MRYIAQSHGSHGTLPEIRSVSPDKPDGIEIPTCLLANVERHCANLRTLVETLGNAGIDDEMIEASVLQIVQSYQAELLFKIKNLHKEAANA